MVLRRLSDETVDICVVPEKHVNQENPVNAEEGIKLGIFSASCALGHVDCKEDCASKKETAITAATGMKKSIEMQVAQEG